MSSIAGDIQYRDIESTETIFQKLFGGMVFQEKFGPSGRTKVDRRRRHGQKGSDGSAEIGRKEIMAIRSGINRRSSIRLDEHNLHADYERVCGRLGSMPPRGWRLFLFSSISHVPRKQLAIEHKSGPF